jgi:hypothetical protein
MDLSPTAPLSSKNWDDRSSTDDEVATTDFDDFCSRTSSPAMVLMFEDKGDENRVPGKLAFSPTAQRKKGKKSNRSPKSQMYSTVGRRKQRRYENDFFFSPGDTKGNKDVPKNPTLLSITCLNSFVLDDDRRATKTPDVFSKLKNESLEVYHDFAEGENIAPQTVCIKKPCSTKADETLILPVPSRLECFVSEIENLLDKEAPRSKQCSIVGEEADKLVLSVKMASPYYRKIAHEIAKLHKIPSWTKHGLKASETCIRFLFRAAV